MRADASFAVMGATAAVTVVDGPRGLVEIARGRLTHLERRWSRFVASSEVSRLNHAGGEPLRVSAETRLLVRRALEGYRVTGGRFDPTLLGAVLRAGYVDSFERLDRGVPRFTSALRTGAHRIEVDDGAGTVRIPDGVGFDPGGIGKGLAADIVAEDLMRFGAAGVCVNVGGDVRVAGRSPSGESWRIEVEHPVTSLPVATLEVRNGAVATSSRIRRQWTTVDGDERHHLMDPATGTSARSPVLAATAVAAMGWQAEVLAKAAFLGAAGGLDLVDDLGAAAMVLVPDGMLASAAWNELVTRPEVVDRSDRHPDVHPRDRTEVRP
jgi:thiamine biosynthesis lipoprotein